MTSINPRPSVPPSPHFQFSLRTLLLLFVVLGSSLAVFGGWGIVVFSFAIAIIVSVREARSFRIAVYALAVLVALSFLSVPLIGLLVLRKVGSAASSGWESDRRLDCADNIIKISRALACYHQINGHFPPTYVADKSGKPMHSWRVLITPHLDSFPGSYNSDAFAEPWDGKHVADLDERAYLSLSGRFDQQ